MKQAISGVGPSQTSEVTVMTVWPSIASFGIGEALGRAYAIKFPNIAFLRIGNLIALASIPIALALYFFRLFPSFFGIPIYGEFYRLTNRRILVLRNEIYFGASLIPKFRFGSETRSLQLDRFDSIAIEVTPGQAWYDAGNLIFRQGDTETFRLVGVSRPEAFRQVCLKSHMAYVGVKQVMRTQAAV